MLRRTLRISLDRANAQKTSAELPLRPCHELSESPELQAQAVARGTRLLCVLILTFVASLSPVFSAGADRDDRAFPGASLFVDVRLDAPRKLSGLKPGSSLEGAVKRYPGSGREPELLLALGQTGHVESKDFSKDAQAAALRATVKVVNLTKNREASAVIAGRNSPT